jgi:ketosteroid isomerase-like protein
MSTFPRPGHATDDEHFIRTIPVDFARYYEARDVDQLATLFSDDGRVLAPFRPVGQGRMGLRDTFKTSFVQYDPKDLKLVTIFVEVCGHVAYGYGTYSMNIKLPNGTRVDDRGKWLACLRRVTSWKMVAQCWNSDLPLSAFMS